MNEKYRKYALVELHLHLDGALSSKAIIEVAKKEGFNLPTFDEEELNKYLIVPKNCQSLNEYLERFDIPNLALQTEFGLRTCTLDLLKRLSDDGIKYAEIRMAPQLSTQGKLTQEEVVIILINVLRMGEQLYGIKSNLILCLMRGAPKEKNLETIEVARRYLNHGVVLLDFAGAEALWPNNIYLDEFRIINGYNIPFTNHAGEALGAESVKIALENRAVRIGHGTHSYQDEEVMDYLVKHEIPLEMCPTSSIDTKAIKNYQEMPIKQYLERGIKVTLSTDDPTVSNVTLKDEYAHLKEDMGLSDNDLHTIALNSINAARLSEQEKEVLIQILEKNV